MGDDLVTDASLRQFLLGQLSEDERQQIERIFITDSQARERILLVEQDLIEDYLDDLLTATQREQFIEQYTATPAQSRKLRITKSIKERARKEEEFPTVPQTTAVSNRLRERVRPRLVLFVPIAAAIAIAIVCVAIWLNRRVERQTRRLTIAREVIQLNAPSNRHQITPGKTSLELKPGAFRSVESSPQLVKSAGQAVELRLVWTRKERYPRYRAVVQRVGGDEPIPVEDLRADDDGQIIRLSLPTHILTRGTYLIELSGVSAEGTGPAEEYQFTVSE